MQWLAYDVNYSAVKDIRKIYQDSRDVKEHEEVKEVTPSVYKELSPFPTKRKHKDSAVSSFDSEADLI